MLKMIRVLKTSGIKELANDLGTIVGNTCYTYWIHFISHNRLLERLI